MCMVCRNNLKKGVFKLYIELQAPSNDTVFIHFIIIQLLYFGMNSFCFDLTDKKISYKHLVIIFMLMCVTFPFLI